MIGAIIQARTGSVRFPNKIFEKIYDKTCLEHVCHNVSKSKQLQRVILAMPKSDRYPLSEWAVLSKLENIANRLKVDSIYFGSEKNVLSRYYCAAKEVGLDTVVRITADCPLIKPHIIDDMIFYYNVNGYNCFLHNRGPNGAISGFDVEIFPFSFLAAAMSEATKEEDLEHVTTYIKRRFGSAIKEFKNDELSAGIVGYDKLSFDTPKDLKKIKEYMRKNGKK